MRVCAYEHCNLGPGGTRAVIPDDAFETKRFCLSKHRTAQFKLDQRAKVQQKPWPSGLQVSYGRAVQMAERIMRESLMWGQVPGERIPDMAREYVLEALPARQRERLENQEAGR